jgi:hypothetical protein
MPNPTYLIDKSGRVAFRSLWSRVSSVAEALKELLHAQKERHTDHAVVMDGEDLSVPMGTAILNSHRALGRGGKKSINEFREGLGGAGRVAHTTARVVGPVVLNPGRALTAAGIAASVIAGGLYVGYRLRKARLNHSSYNPYQYNSRRKDRSDSDYAVGI